MNIARTVSSFSFCFHHILIFLSLKNYFACDAEFTVLLQFKIDENS